jgi:hypothetical protein
MNAGNCGHPEGFWKSLGTEKGHNLIAGRHKPLNPDTGDINADGTVE